MAVGLRAVAHHLPERRVPNHELTTQFRDAEGRSLLTARSLERLTGVVERRYAEPGCCSSDLGAAAAERVLAAAQIAPSSIDVLIFAAASHDLAEPATANRVQVLTGCNNARVLDVKNACNSFLDALDVARAMIVAGSATRVLLVTGEVISPFVAKVVPSGEAARRYVAGLTLGDAGAAAVVERWSPACLGQIGVGSFRSAGRHWDKSAIFAGGSLAVGNCAGAHFVSDSAALFAVAAEELPPVVASVLARQGWSAADVDLVVPHQVSRAVTQVICDRTGIPVERCAMTLPALGNTAAASIPTALSMSIEQGRLEGARRVLLVGGAAGFSAAAIPLSTGGG